MIIRFESFLDINSKAYYFCPQLMSIELIIFKQQFMDLRIFYCLKLEKMLLVTYLDHLVNDKTHVFLIELLEDFSWVVKSDLILNMCFRSWDRLEYKGHQASFMLQKLVDANNLLLFPLEIILYLLLIEKIKIQLILLHQDYMIKVEE